MLQHGPIKTIFPAFENLLWTASVAFPSWAGAISLFYMMLVGDISAIGIQRLFEHK